MMYVYNQLSKNLAILSERLSFFIKKLKTFVV